MNEARATDCERVCVLYALACVRVCVERCRPKGNRNAIHSHCQCSLFYLCSPNNHCVWIALSFSTHLGWKMGLSGIEGDSDRTTKQVVCILLHHIVNSVLRSTLALHYVHNDMVAATLVTECHPIWHCLLELSVRRLLFISFILVPP